MLWHGKNFRGIINKAKQMIFDNTGTDLVSTNAEDAIKEVNGKFTEWTLAGTLSATGINNAVTIPEGAKEVFVYGTSRSGNSPSDSTYLIKISNITAMSGQIINPATPSFTQSMMNIVWRYDTGVYISEVVGSTGIILLYIYYK